MSEQRNQGIAYRIKLKSLFNKCQTLLLTIAVITGTVGTVWFAATHIADQREREDIALTRALRIRDDVEMLASLHVAANTDFLKGIGTSQWASYAWPVARVGTATRTYDDLERAFLGEPASLSAIQTLRLTTSRWEWELEIATATAIRRGNSIAIDSSRLLSANENTTRDLGRVGHASCNPKRVCWQPRSEICTATKFRARAPYPVGIRGAGLSELWICC